VIAPAAVEASAPDDPQLVSLEIADTLVSSGVVGVGLAKLLRDRFPAAKRAEVFLGVAIAMTDIHAELLIAEAEIAQLRSQIGAAVGR
jgi:hypothetical protein